MKNLILTILFASFGCAIFSQELVRYYVEVDYDGIFTWEQKTCEFLQVSGEKHPILTTNDTGSIYYYVDTVNLSNIEFLVLPGDNNQYVKGNGSIAAFPVSTGKDTISGVAAMTSYVVAHNYGYVPVITLTPRSADAAADCYVSSIDSNTFTITFINQPPVGTDNIIFDWVAIKP